MLRRPWLSGLTGLLHTYFCKIDRQFKRSLLLTLRPGIAVVWLPREQVPRVVYVIIYAGLKTLATFLFFADRNMSLVIVLRLDCREKGIKKKK